jgi:hypothetical protein
MIMGIMSCTIRALERLESYMKAISGRLIAKISDAIEVNQWGK